MAGAPNSAQPILTVTDLLRSHYGISGLLNRRISTPNIGAAAEQILAANPQRVLYLVSNPSVNNLWVAENDQVAVSAGYLCAANGGFITRKWRDDLSTVTDELWGIGAAAGTLLYVVEWELI